VKSPVDTLHAAHRHRDPGVPQIAECGLVVLGGHQRAGPGQFVRCHLGGGEPGREQVQFPADRDQLGRLLPGERRDHHVPVRTADDQVIRLQPPQCLAQRSDRDAEGGGQLHVVNPAARFQHAVENLVPHLEVDAVGFARLAAGPVAIRHKCTLPSPEDFIL
jgi:hypothetical protein